MSDMLNEKFEEFLGEQQVVMEAGAQDPCLVLLPQ